MKKSTFWTPLYLGANEDPFRPHFGYVFFYERNIWATDTHMAYRINSSSYGLVQEQINILEGKCLSVKQMKRVCRKPSFFITPEGILHPDTNSLYTYYSIDEVCSSLKKIVPEMIKEIMFTTYEQQDTPEIGVNPTLLENMKRCFGCTILNLNIQAANKAIICKPSNGASLDAIGIVMPAMIWD